MPSGERGEQPAVDPTGFDADTFRSIMSGHPTGVTVVTATNDGTPVGMAANSFTSVSLDPPLVLFCVAYSSETWPDIEAAGHFVVNLMPSESAALVGRFAAKGVDRFEDVAYRTGVTGGPILEVASAYLDCEIVATHEGGDHAIVVGQVMDLNRNSDDLPLIFHSSRFAHLQAD